MDTYNWTKHITSVIVQGVLWFTVSLVDSSNCVFMVRVTGDVKSTPLLVDICVFILPGASAGLWLWWRRLNYSYLFTETKEPECKQSTEVFMKMTYFWLPSCFYLCCMWKASVYGSYYNVVLYGWMKMWLAVVHLCFSTCLFSSALEYQLFVRGLSPSHNVLLWQEHFTIYLQ